MAARGIWMVSDILEVQGIWAVRGIWMAQVALMVSDILEVQGIWVVPGIWMAQVALMVSDILEVQGILEVQDNLVLPPHNRSRLKLFSYCIFVIRPSG